MTLKIFLKEYFYEFKSIYLRKIVKKQFQNYIIIIKIYLPSQTGKINSTIKRVS